MFSNQKEFIKRKKERSKKEERSGYNIVEWRFKKVPSQRKIRT